MKVIFAIPFLCWVCLRFIVFQPLLIFKAKSSLYIFIKYI